MVETFKLYGGAVELCFDHGAHLYTVGGEPVDGVTSVLGVIAKPALVPWAVKVTCEHLERVWMPGRSYDEIERARHLADAKRAHREKTGDAAAIGTLVHGYAEAVIAGQTPAVPINAEARNGVAAFADWMKAHRVKPLLSERKVYSRAYSYAGTVDLVAEVDGRLTVLDYKTSSGIYSEMRYQVSAYKEALVEEGVVPLDAARAIIRFDKKDGSFEFHRLPDDQHDADAEAFLAALALHRRQKFHNPPRNRRAA